MGKYFLPLQKLSSLPPAIPCDVVTKSADLVAAYSEHRQWQNQLLSKSRGGGGGTDGEDWNTLVLKLLKLFFQV